jgi:hypothetical protein
MFYPIVPWKLEWPEVTSLGCDPPPRWVDVHPSVVLLYLVAKLLMKVSSPMLARTLWLLGDGTKTMQALVHPPKDERPSGLASCLTVEGSESSMDRVYR